MKTIFSGFKTCIAIIMIILVQSCFLQAQEDSERRKKKSDAEEKKGKLEQFMGEDDSENKDKIEQLEDEEDDDSGSCGSFWVEFFLKAGWEFTKLLLFSPPLDSTRFMSYPYAQGEFGLAVEDVSVSQKPGFGQIQFAYQYIDHDLYGILFSFRGRLNDIAGLHLDISQYKEDLINKPDDTMMIIRLGLMKSLMIREQMIWDLDIGLRTLEDNAGFDAGMRWQIFPKLPFCLDLWTTAGSMNRLLFLEFKPILGIIIHRFQWDLGFRYLRWKDEDLHGAFAGIRVWF